MMIIYHPDSITDANCINLYNSRGISQNKLKIEYFSIPIQLLLLSHSRNCVHTWYHNCYAVYTSHLYVVKMFLLPPTIHLGYAKNCTTVGTRVYKTVILCTSNKVNHCNSSPTLWILTQIVGIISCNAFKWRRTRTRETLFVFLLHHGPLLEIVSRRNVMKSDEFEIKGTKNTITNLTVG